MKINDAEKGWDERRVAMEMDRTDVERSQLPLPQPHISIAQPGLGIYVLPLQFLHTFLVLIIAIACDRSTNLSHPYNMDAYAWLSMWPEDSQVLRSPRRAG